MIESALKRTPLHNLHLELGAKMVPFAGYDMPVQYPTGILTEHLQTRSQAGLFDVSHMGQLRLTAKPGAAASPRRWSASSPPTSPGSPPAARAMPSSPMNRAASSTISW